MVQYSYILLQTSDAGATLSKRFRVIAEGYNDGQLSKSQSVEKTVGGGLDASVGAVYKSWNPIIRVKHTEEDSNYGNLADLKTFYNYNDPGGTPSNVITFVDHHGQNYNVIMTGDFQSQVLGCMIEGTNSHYMVQLTLEEVV